MLNLKSSLFKNISKTLIFRSTPRFWASTTDILAASKELKTEETPVHLRPYDKNKFEVPSTKLKMGSGYALLDLEPMPRAKIMKICYTLLERLKEIPEKALYRIYTEEKVKYIMRLTDEVDDIRRLEEELGYDSIEMFIQSLHSEIPLLEHMKEFKPWIPRPEETELMKYSKIPREELKHMKYDKPAREQAKFITNK